MLETLLFWINRIGANIFARRTDTVWSNQHFDQPGPISRMALHSTKKQRASHGWGRLRRFRFALSISGSWGVSFLDLEQTRQGRFFHVFSGMAINQAEIFV
jgi:hypothetical protein